jgi:hypothetical protein
MANRVFGVDSLSPVTESLVAEVQQAFGATPAFWGRYFTSKTTTGTGEFHHVAEGGILRAHGIRVLPIARQTNKVGGTRADGQSDGQSNGADLLATFGVAELVAAGQPVRIFLDVEGGGVSHLSPDYYEGWVEGLAQASTAQGVTILPCVYGIPSDGATWKALSSSVGAGVACGGVWLSHPRAAVVEPADWDAAMLKPFPGIDGVPILLWQYFFGKSFDRNMTNPDLGDAQDFLNSLVLPAAPAVGVFA